MNETQRKKQPDLLALPAITLRKLEIFSAVCRESSYGNAALELRTTRANVKRACQELEQAVGHPLFEEKDRVLHATPFAQGLLARMTPLSRGLRRMEEGVRSLHQAGRVLRFAAAGEFFRGGRFTEILARLKIQDAFRPCFLKIETSRYRNALLNAECDVYFGLSLNPPDRMDGIDLGPVPWKIVSHGPPPRCPADLRDDDWALADAGETGAADSLLAAFRAAGASHGAVHHPEAGDRKTVFLPDITSRAEETPHSDWPCYRFTAVLRKHHPYSDLKSRFDAVACS